MSQTSLFPGVVHDPSKAASERDREQSREIMSRRRAAGRQVSIPPVADRARRAECRLSLRRFCEIYFAGLFALDWADYHLEVMRRLQQAILYGGRIALAAPRGGGKTTITTTALVWAIVYGHARHVIVVAETSTEAKKRLREVKRALDSRGTVLADDFPEVCEPAAALEGAPQRAAKQTCGGARTGIVWGEDEVVIASVDGSPAAGTRVLARGLEGSIRGQVEAGVRPDLVLLDDPQTRESAHSVLQTGTRDEILRQDIEGLVGPGEELTIIGLWTIICRGDLADIYTSDERPHYRSMLYQAMPKLPPRHLMDNYIQRVHADWIRQPRDSQARAAHLWYLRHREEIEAGSAVAWTANVNRSDVGDEAMSEMAETADLDWSRSPDGSWVWAPDETGLCPMRQMEVSAVQRQLNLIAKLGEDSWSAEYQNAPPNEETQVVSIDNHMVMARMSGLPRRQLPEDTVAIVEGWDVMRSWLYWVTLAICPGRRAAIVDYGSEAVDSPDGRVEPETEEGERRQQAISSAIRSAMRHLRDTHLALPMRTASGREAYVDLICADSRYGTQVVREVADESGQVMIAVMGMGTGDGRRRWVIPRGVPASDVSLDGNLYQRVEHGQVRIYAHVDALKRDAHAGFLPDLSADAPGAIQLFWSDNPTEHVSFSRHITAEREVELAPGVTRFERVRGQRQNHFFDSLVYALAASSIVEHWRPEARLEAPAAAKPPINRPPSPDGGEPKQRSGRRRKRRRAVIAD